MLLRMDQTGDWVCCVRGGWVVEGVSGGAGQPASFPPQPGLQRGERTGGCALSEAPWSDCQQQQKPVTAGGLIVVGGGGVAVTEVSLQTGTGRHRVMR